MPNRNTAHAFHHAAHSETSVDTAVALAVPALPRPKALTALDFQRHLLAREAGRELAARLWRRAIAGQTVAIAEQLGISHPQVSRMAAGDKPVHLGDVLAIDPQVAARVLLAALDHVEGRPVAGEALPLGEALQVSRTVIEVLVQLERTPVEAMSLADRHQLADLLEGAIEKLRRLVRRLRGGVR